MKRVRSLALAVFALATTASFASANAPVGRYTVSGGTVLDTRTNLTWQQVVSTTKITSTAATAYCSNLPAAGGGWRVPTVKELFSLVDFTLYDLRLSTMLDTTAFPGEPAGSYWTSTAFVGSTTAQVWLVLFDSGITASTAPASTDYVRCVR